MYWKIFWQTVTAVCEIHGRDLSFEVGNRRMGHDAVRFVRHGIRKNNIVPYKH